MEQPQKPKMNIWTKWGIGCLGCLGVVVIMGIVLGGCSLMWFASDSSPSSSKLTVAKMSDEEIVDLKENAQTIDYPHLKKNPDKYKGEYVKYTGEIVQILESGSRSDIRLAVTKTDYGYDFSDIIYVTYFGTTDFVEGDVVTIYGTITGTHRYKSTANFNIEVPGVEAVDVAVVEVSE